MILGRLWASTLWLTCFFSAMIWQLGWVKIWHFQFGAENMEAIFEPVETVSVSVDTQIDKCNLAAWWWSAASRNENNPLFFSFFKFIYVFIFWPKNVKNHLRSQLATVFNSEKHARHVSFKTFLSENATDRHVCCFACGHQRSATQFQACRRHKANIMGVPQPWRGGATKVPAMPPWFGWQHKEKRSPSLLRLKVISLRSSDTLGFSLWIGHSWPSRSNQVTTLCVAEIAVYARNRQQWEQWQPGIALVAMKSYKSNGVITGAS